jgi:hypothetical protein
MRPYLHEGIDSGCSHRGDRIRETHRRTDRTGKIASVDLVPGQSCACERGEHRRCSLGARYIAKVPCKVFRQVRHLG